MKLNQNPWDVLGRKNFNTHLKENEIDPRAADNILIAWPSILKELLSEYKQAKNIKVLDFGCGTGGFCNKLNRLGFNVTGIDPSREMLKTARHNSPKSIRYIKGDQKNLSSLESFHIITSIMTFPFIDNFKDAFKRLVKKLKPNGLIILADFNRAWVKVCLSNKVSFANFDSNKDPKKGGKVFGDIRIPVFIRSAKEYDEIAKLNGLTKIFEDCPPFTKTFIKQYPDKRPKHIPEYLILGYKKI